MEVALYSLIVFVVAAAAVVSVKPLLLVMARLPDRFHISGWRGKKIVHDVRCIESVFF